MNNYNYDWYRNNTNQMFFNGMNYNQNLYSPKEGFEKGNMFSNLYEQYKTYRPINVNPMTEQEKMLYEIQTMCFAAHELNLYLDLHPEDKSMIILFKDYQDQIRSLKNEYENKYGPLTVNGVKNENLFTWESATWPWDRNMNMRGVDYNV